MAFEAIKYLIDNTAVEERIAIGRTPPVKNVYADNDLAQQALDLVLNASGCQLYYDQYLSSAMAEVHKDNLQAMIGLEISPEEYNNIMETSAAEMAGE